MPPLITEYISVHTKVEEIFFKQRLFAILDQNFVSNMS